MCRHVLGAHKKSRVSAGRGEMDRFAVGIDLVGNVAVCKLYLRSKEEGTLLFETFQWNKQLTAACRPQSSLIAGWAITTSCVRYKTSSRAMFVLTVTGKP